MPRDRPTRRRPPGRAEGTGIELPKTGRWAVCSFAREGHVRDLRSVRGHGMATLDQGARREPGSVCSRRINRVKEIRKIGGKPLRNYPRTALMAWNLLELRS